MAFMNQERKKTLVALAKPILKKYGMKGTFKVDNHSGINCTVKSGPIDFASLYNASDEYRVNWRGYHQVNPYWIDKHWNGVARDFLTELKDALFTGNHDRSDIRFDHHDVGWYVYINIGKWDKPYKLEPNALERAADVPFGTLSWD